MLRGVTGGASVCAASQPKILLHSAECDFNSSWPGRQSSEMRDSMTMMMQTSSCVNLSGSSIAVTGSSDAVAESWLGCADIVQDSISRSDVDVRRELYNSILLTGTALCLVSSVAGLWLWLRLTCIGSILQRQMATSAKSSQPSLNLRSCLGKRNASAKLGSKQRATALAWDALGGVEVQCNTQESFFDIE